MGRCMRIARVFDSPIAIIFLCLLLPCESLICGGGSGIRSINEFSSSYSISSRQHRHVISHTRGSSSSVGSGAGVSGYDKDEEYSRCLTPKQEKDQVLREGYALYDEKPRWNKFLSKPVRKLRRAISPSHVPQPGNLILIKCGETLWKRNHTFTGWADPDLTPQGIQECEHAARLLLEAGYHPDVVYTSRLKRAIHSVWVIMMELNCPFVPAFKSWRLNERMYGSLQGLCKKETAERLGANVVQAWRKSMKARPPPVKIGGEHDPGLNRRYFDLTKEQIPLTESLEDCMLRTRPLWDYKITRELRRGNNVLVVAHTNSLRGLTKIIDNIQDSDMEDVSFLPGIPFVYKFDKNMKSIPPSEGTPTQKHTTGTFLEKPGLLKEALKLQKAYRGGVPGSLPTEVDATAKRASTLENSLLKLKEEKEMEKWVETLIHNVDDTNGVNYQDQDDGHFEEGSHQKPSVSALPNVGKLSAQEDPVVVLIRHGRTPHNQLALFTGWEDPPLTEEGVEDAKRAGRLLKHHGFEFDVVYSSWLTRAIETAWYVVNELDMQWLPVVKSWRLNERHYGALTGKSKKMVGNIYGTDQLNKWRRSFDIPPPPASSYSFSYPGNDVRRTKYVKDIRISWTETFCRSIEARKLQIHRKFPKSESLKTCMARTIPFYTEKIVPEAVAKGKRVLITSHENAIRGILMHLCEIPKEHMNDLHLPNGLPLIYNVRRKCISLLDDDSGKIHDFGSAAQYLFRPCELLDEDFIVTEEE